MIATGTATHGMLALVRDAPTILDAVDLFDDVARAARLDVPASAEALRRAITDDDDTLVTLAAVHAAGAVGGRVAKDLLVNLLLEGPPLLREHAAWALAAGPPVDTAVAPLREMAQVADFAGTLAGVTLRTWEAAGAPAIRSATHPGTHPTADPGTHTTAHPGDDLGVGAAPHASPAPSLSPVPTLSPAPALSASLPAVPGPALSPTASSLSPAPALSAVPGPALSPTASLASSLSASSAPSLSASPALSLTASPVPSLSAVPAPSLTASPAPSLSAVPDAVGTSDATAPAAPGLTIAQLYLHGEIDAELRHAGRGDTGGIATLLVRLGDALLEEPGVARVLTLSRASERAGSGQVPPGRVTTLAGRPGHHYLGIPVPRPTPTASRSWPLLTTVRESLREQLAQAGPVDVIHVRMADVGSWAIAQVARELGIPLVLTLAPDPHALLAVRERTGRLTRASFADADLREHLVFRIRLLRELREQAEALVVFPRPELQEDLSALLHVGPDEPVHVVPEGIDVEALDEADRQVALAMEDCVRGEGGEIEGVEGVAVGEGGGVEPGTVAALAELDALLGRLPEERRGLPLLLSVGRLHAVKGMASLVTAWADHPELSQRCNLLIVGGDLEHPTHDEEEQLALIDAVVDRAEGPARGLILAGHRPNTTVATWLSAGRRGRPGLSAPGGVYACASLKEEFGIALCEALGSGLVVVAPEHGGPPTYIEHGRTGVLVDTSDPRLLGEAVGEALRLAVADDTEQRVAHARQVVLDRFSIRTMARALSSVYQQVAR